MNGFAFHFGDFRLSLLSILFEGLPFLVLGTLLSGLIEAFLPANAMERILPRKPWAAVLVSGTLGMLFPVCECAVVPVIRRLMQKGLPVSCALTYMLAAPIVNPVVALSTYAAFTNQGALTMVAWRLGLGWSIAVFLGLLLIKVSPSKILRPSIAQSLETPAERKAVKKPFSTKVNTALSTSMQDFVEVGALLVLGASFTAIFNTSIPEQFILPFAESAYLASASLMALAFILSLCSTSDAFIAATLVAFPFGAKLAFLVFGPMFDLKLIFLYQSIFKRRAILVLGLTLFAIIGLITGRLSTILTIW